MMNTWLQTQLFLYIYINAIRLSVSYCSHSMYAGKSSGEGNLGLLIIATFLDTQIRSPRLYVLPFHMLCFMSQSYCCRFLMRNTGIASKETWIHVCARAFVLNPVTLACDSREQRKFLLTRHTFVCLTSFYYCVVRFCVQLYENNKQKSHPRYTRHLVMMIQPFLL